jgi:sterol desaturase/sphingolipid hydroxylase (fatty acid hydroxylase superfamily)
MPARSRLIDLGKRAGVSAGFLGALAVLAELCFRFPDVLVSKDLRPMYLEHIEIFRALLQLGIVAAFLLGAASVVLLRSKAHGLLGMGLATIAILLGGSKAEALTSRPRALTVGLDYFVIELLLLGVVFVPMERLWALHEQKIFRLGWQTDLKHLFLSHTGVQVLSFVTLIPVQVALGWTTGWSFRASVAAQPVILQFVEILFAVDLVSYWVHRAFHQVPLLWRFHAIHHSSLHMDWLAGSRTHIVDIVVNRTLGFVPIFVLGFSAPALYAYLLFVSYHAVYIHANVRHRWPGLRWVLATPEFHHWHHTSDEEGIDKNFAVFIAFIDVMFGTAHLPPYWPKRYGTVKFQPPETYLGQLAHPFRAHQETPYG